MRRSLAGKLNSLALICEDRGKPRLAESLYKLATRVDSTWSVPWYNLGLRAKYANLWEESRRFNQRALELNPTDEGAIWNLGIAATALNDWGEARKAWTAYGIELLEDEAEVRMPSVTGCVRLDPHGCGEVVWGERLDPARILVTNVPLPASGRRFRDVILNDGAESGKRVDSHGNEIAVFDELCIWEVSPFSTFRANLRIPDKDSERRLEDLCLANEVGVEDWSTIRFICATCSRGNPGPHTCVAKQPGDGNRRFGFAAKSSQVLVGVIQEWDSAHGNADCDQPELVLPPTST